MAKDSLTIGNIIIASMSLGKAITILRKPRWSNQGQRHEYEA
jgi:hypothetical protein